MRRLALIFLSVLFAHSLYSRDVAQDEYCDIFLCISEFMEDSGIVSADMYWMAKTAMLEKGFVPDSSEGDKVRLYPKVYGKGKDVADIDCEALEGRYGKLEVFEYKAGADFEPVEYDVRPLIRFVQPKFEGDCIHVLAFLDIDYHNGVHMEFKLKKEDGKYRVVSSLRRVKY
ncbi:MAG: hypothetical protein U0L74_05920 [Paludibacteraceae bacterium]|nr:hypothetical protein [Paludibacteraceae bacterium]